jgi:hypothetical protein
MWNEEKRVEANDKLSKQLYHSRDVKIPVLIKSRMFSE